MSAIVLNSYLRSTIRFNKEANEKAYKVNQLNADGQITAANSPSRIQSLHSAKRLKNDIAEMNNDLRSVDQVVSTLKTTTSSIKEMRKMVKQIQTLETTRAEATSNSQIESLSAQIVEIREQILKMAQNSTFQGRNLLTSWGNEEVTIGKTDIKLSSMSLDDIVNGKASRGGVDNFLNIGDGQFDTSSYPDLIAAYGANLNSGTFADYTGGYPDAQMINGAALESSGGPNDASQLVFDNPTNLSRASSGPYAQLPTMTIPAEFTISTWAKFDSAGNWTAAFEFSYKDDPASLAQPPLNIDLLRNGSTDQMQFAIKRHDTEAWVRVNSQSGEFITGEWAYWTATVKNVGADAEIALYKDGDLQNTTLISDYNFTERTVNNNFFGSNWNQNDATMNGAVSDLVIIDRAFDESEVDALYQDLGLTGTENKFFSMLSSDELDTVLEKAERHYSTQLTISETIKENISFKQSLAEGHVADILSINKEKTATEVNLASLRQNLSMTSLGIANQLQSNILQLF